jgi:hypothetical protein
MDEGKVIYTEILPKGVAVKMEGKLFIGIKKCKKKESA